MSYLVRCPKCPRSVPDRDLVRLHRQLAVCRWCARDIVTMALDVELASQADVARDDIDQVRR